MYTTKQSSWNNRNYTNIPTTRQRQKNDAYTVLYIDKQLSNCVNPVRRLFFHSIFNDLTTMSLVYHPWKYVPTDIIYTLQKYISPFDYYSFLISSKTFEEIKFHSWKIVLREDDVVKYIEDASFRARIASRIKHLEQQLFICYSRDNARHLLHFQEILSIPSRGVSIYSSSGKNLVWHDSLNEKQEIDIISCNNIDNISEISFHRLKRLRLSFIHSIASFPNTISSLLELKLFYCNSITDVTCFKNIQTLSIRQCNKIQDISPLNRISFLTIEECSGIEDISQLTHHHSLTVMRCPYINPGSINFQEIVELKTDLLPQSYAAAEEKLSKLKTLKIFFCGYSKTNTSNANDNDDNHEDQMVYIPPSVRHATIQFLQNKSFLSLSSFCFSQHLLSVHFDSIDHLSNIHVCSSIPFVQISHSLIAHVDGLGEKNRRVEICHCPNIHDFSPLATVSTVVIDHCEQFKNVAQLNRVKHLKISFCMNFTDTSPCSLNSLLQSLEILSCKSLKRLDGLGRVPFVSVIRCHKLRSLRGLGENLKIVLDRNALQNLVLHYPDLVEHFQVNCCNSETVTLLRNVYRGSNNEITP